MSARAAVSTVSPHDRRSVDFPAAAPTDLPPSQDVGQCRWRYQPTGAPYSGLVEALAAVRRDLPSRPDVQALAWWLLPRLPGVPMVSDSVKSDRPTSGRLAMEDAVTTMGWLGVNTHAAVNVVWVDVDSDDWHDRLERAVAAGIPRPNYECRDERGPHLAWVLDRPAFASGADPKKDAARARKVSLARSYLLTALDGDQAAGLRAMPKNPFAPGSRDGTRWHVDVNHLVPCTLDDIIRPLETLAKAEGWEAPQSRRRARDASERSPHGAGIFDAVRFHAYDTAETDERVLFDVAAEAAERLGSPATLRMQREMARSVSRFMTRRWTGRVRAARLTPVQATARQAEAGRKTAATRASTRDGRISEAATALAGRGATVTQRAVAEEAGMALRTVQRGWSVLAATSPHAPPLSVTSEGNTPESEAMTSAGGSDDDSVHAANPPPGLLVTDCAPTRQDERHRLKGKAARREREQTHQLAANGGQEGYRVFLAARMRFLIWQRWDDLSALPTPNGQRFMEDPTATSAEWQVALRAHERRALCSSGWASRFRAEDRVVRRVEQAMGWGSGRFRTTHDLTDLRAMAAGSPANDER